MEQDMERVLTRRELLARALAAVTGVVLLPLLSDPGREKKGEDSKKNISDRDASFYRTLAG